MARFSVRLATQDDTDAMATLLTEYVRSELHADWIGSVERLREDGFGSRFELLLALAPSQDLIGFTAFAPDYDLHVCVRGARVLDLYVLPEWRGRGVAAVLLAHAAQEILNRGGQYMKGAAQPNAPIVNFYSRCAVPFQGPEFTLSAKAFRHVAGLAGCDPRHIAANLPEKQWNFVE
jgi:GNAT superfamily N-acetyltransferase